MSQDTIKQVVNSAAPTQEKFHHHLAAVQVMFTTKDGAANAMPVNVVYTTDAGVMDARGLQEIGSMAQQEFMRRIPDADKAKFEIFNTCIMSISDLGVQSMNDFAGAIVKPSAEAETASAAANDKA